MRRILVKLCDNYAANLSKLCGKSLFSLLSRVGNMPQKYSCDTCTLVQTLQSMGLYEHDALPVMVNNHVTGSAEQFPYTLIDIGAKLFCTIRRQNFSLLAACQRLWLFSQR